MHILHLIKTSEGATWAFEFIRDMKRNYPDITFSVILPSGGKNYNNYYSICASVYDLKFSLNRSAISRGLKLRQIVKKEQPDIIHSWFAQTTMYARLFLRDVKIPRLFEVVGPLHLEYFFYRLFDIYSAQNVDFWKATSKYTYNKYLKARLHKDKLFLNYIGIDLNSILEEKDNHQPVKLKESYNLPSGVKIIGSASYMYPPKLFEKSGVKNHELLLEVFSELLNRRDDIILVIGGSTLDDDKNYEIKLKKQANKISPDKIIFTGFVQNLGRLISEFDVFVFLSKSENLGGVYESLLFEVPTVSSNRGGIPELVINNETGFTSNLQSIKDIANKIEILLDNKNIADKFKTNGKHRVFSVFDKKKSIDNSFKIYQRILNHSHENK